MCVCVLFRVRDTLHVLVASKALKIISRVGFRV
jgi:hypothetical protein